MNIYECELCEKSEDEAVLVMYPFVTLHKGMKTHAENEDEDTFICLKCLEADCKTINRTMG